MRGRSPQRTHQHQNRHDHNTRTISVPTEIGTARGGGGRAFALVAEIDAAAREIVGRNLHDDAVADAGADAELAHLARHIRENLVLVVERHAIIAVGQHLGDGAIEFEQLFLGHVFFSNPILLLRALAGVGAELAAGAAPGGPHEGDRADPVAGGRLLASLLLRRSSWWFPVASRLVLAIVALMVPRRR